MWFQLEGLSVSITILQAWISFNWYTIFSKKKINSPPDPFTHVMKAAQKTLPTCFTFSGSPFGLSSPVLKYPVSDTDTDSHYWPKLKKGFGHKT